MPSAEEDLVIGRRLAPLSDGSRALLDVIAVAGTALPPDVLTQVSGRPAAEVAAHVDEAVNAGLLAGAFLIERFFSIPGIGREVILAVERSDFPVIKAVTIYVAFATVLINLLADLLYKAVDPRVQLK